MNELDLEQLLKRIEADPSQLKNDFNKAGSFMFAHLVNDINSSIKALDTLIQGAVPENNRPCLKDLKKEWSVFMEKSTLPNI
jgi:hypothetical protein